MVSSFRLSRKTALVCSASALVFMLGQPAHADPLQDLLNTLLANHTITQAQYNQLKGSIAHTNATQATKARTQPTRQETQQQQQADTAAVQAANQAAAAAATATAAAAQAQKAVQQAQNGFNVGPNFGDLHFGGNTLHIGGKLQIDEPLVATDNDRDNLGTAGNVRRAYIDLRGTLGQDWDYRFEFGTSSGSLSVAWARFGYSGLQHLVGSPLSLWFGYQKTMFSLDNQTADEDRLFTEGPLPVNALVSSKEIGAAAFDGGKWWMLSAGGFNGSATTAPTSGTNNGWQFSGRGALFPINRDGMLVEIGASIARQEPNSTDTFSSVKTQPEENVVAADLVSTGTISDVKGVTTAGLEAAAQYHQFLVEGEWLGQQVERTPTKAAPTDAYFNGWYVQGAWTITGESHPWKSTQAVFGGIEPKHPFDPFGSGGWARSRSLRATAWST